MPTHGGWVPAIPGVFVKIHNSGVVGALHFMMLLSLCNLEDDLLITSLICRGLHTGCVRSMRQAVRFESLCYSWKKANYWGEYLWILYHQIWLVKINLNYKVTMSQKGGPPTFRLIVLDSSVSGVLSVGRWHVDDELFSETDMASPDIQKP
jgi:hypothetical protein